MTALGITNQRETTLAWDSKTGVLPMAWILKHTSVSQICDRLDAQRSTK